MKRAQMSRVAALAVLGLVLAGACLGACGSERDAFRGQGGSFEVDAAVDAPDCRYQCSLDGRSVIEACTGTVVETCRPELACGAGVCQDPCAAAAADKSSNGCEFHFQMPRFTAEHPHSCYASYIVNVSLLPVDIALELEGQPLDVSKSMFRTNPGDPTLIPHEGPVPPGESVILFVSVRDPNVPRTPAESHSFVPCPEGVVPATFAEGLPSGTGIGTSYRLTTKAPVGVSTVYPFGGAASFIPSATLLFPVATWSKQHIIVNGWEVGPGGRPAAQIIASEEDTEVTILPKRDIQDGVDVVGGPARVPVTYRLGKGQLLQLVQGDELTGSIVESTKPTTVIGGNSCANITAKASACDLLAQQIPAFEQWGAEYVGVGYRPRMGNEHEVVPYRIVAARDGTCLDYDPAVPPGAPTTMSAGELVTFHSGTGDAFVVRSQDVDHPIYLSAHMSGGGGDPATNSTFGGWGDPEFVNVVPAGQYLNSYTFYADPTFSETSLVVVRAKTRGELEDVWLECAGALTGWKPIGTRGEYEFVRVDLTRKGGDGESFGTSVCRSGLQRMRSEGPFTATLWGWDRYSSYAYPGGMAQRKLVDTPLSLVR
ncbi:MAG: IgGFc-binding protein [Myxococcales bacterium]|nr:IgGFc-binding protein [Myxococcales bacterium]